jgi:glycosyltransferase involved in cell wall biosynthesis
MKLLRLIGGLDPEHGGPPVSSLFACIAAQREGAETTFAFPLEGKPRGTVADALTRLRAEGVEIKHFPYSTAWGKRGESWGVSLGLARWFGQNYRQFDLIHCHGAWQMVTLIAARRAGAGPPVVLTPHESLTDFDLAQSSSRVTGMLKRRLRGYYGRHIDLFVMSSELEARDSLPAGIDGSDRITVIPHPVFDETDGQPAPKAAKPSPDDFKLGYLGRLHAKKNVDMILRALKGADEDITVSIAGSGPELAQLKALSASLGLDHRVTWLGFIDGDQKQSFFHDINVLLMPSAYECFGMAAAEALVQGVPVIVTPNTGIAEIIRAQGGGDIVAAEVGALREAIANLSQNPDRIFEQGGCAAAAAHNSLSFAAYGAAMMHHYETLLVDRKTTRE